MEMSYSVRIERAYFISSKLPTLLPRQKIGAKSFGTETLQKKDNIMFLER